MAIFKFERGLGTMTAEEAYCRLYNRPSRWRRIADFEDDNECYNLTGFYRDQLFQLLDKFDMDEYIYVSRHDGQRTEMFNKEELLIYSLVKLKSGSTHSHMSDAVTFGCDKRWSHGYRWFMKYIAARYDHLIGPRGIERWVRMFPLFAEAIRNKMSSTFWKYDMDNDEWIDEGSVWFDPGDFAIVGFVDCTTIKTNQPGRGTAGSFAGAPRRHDWYNKQRAFYNRWNGIHGLKILTYNLPNGLIGGSYGPVSNRRNDRIVVEWSEIDDHLTDLQNVMMQEQGDNWPGYYSFFADQGFSAGHWNCLRTRHRPTINVPLTARQVEENTYTNKVRESIEWGYGETKNKWHGLDRHYQKFLDRDMELVCSEVRVALLLTNITTCMRNGNQVSEYFDLDVPSLNDYLTPA
jgi:hypothetical protein